MYSSLKKCNLFSTPRSQSQSTTAQTQLEMFMTQILMTHLLSYFFPTILNISNCPVLTGGNFNTAVDPSVLNFKQYAYPAVNRNTVHEQSWSY